MTPRPRVLANFAASLDGKIAPAPGRRTGRFVMSRGKEDWRRMRTVRARADAILIGAGNLRVDNPGLSLEPTEREQRRADGRPLPARIVLTRTGAGISPEAKMFDPELGGPSYVVHAAAMPEAARRPLWPVAKLVELGAQEVPVERLLSWLTSDLGVGTLLCEGGGELVAGLLAARAVDELYLTIVPRILGGADAPTLAGGPGFSPDEIPDAALVSLEQIGDELFARYEFTWS